MSETKHIKGKLIPTGKTINEFLGGVVLKAYHSNARECFEDEYNGKAFEINGEVYLIDKKEIEPYDDVFDSKINEDGTIDFELKYYNGGCNLNEALGYATKKAI